MTTFTKEDREAVEKSMKEEPYAWEYGGMIFREKEEVFAWWEQMKDEGYTFPPVALFTRPRELTDDEIKEAIKAWGKDYFKDDYTDPHDEDFADILPMLRAVLKTATTKERK